MKNKRSTRDRKKSTPTGMLGSQLAAYSATAAAALVLTPNAHAQIIKITTFNYAGHTNTTTPPSFTLSTGLGRFSFSAGPAMYFAGINVQLTYQHEGFASVGGLKGYSAGFAVDGMNFVKRLELGSVLNEQNFLTSPKYLAQRYGAKVSGNFLPGANGMATGYIGFKGIHGSQDYFGWLNVKVTADANDFPISVTLAALADNPGVFGAYEISTAADISSFRAGDAIAVPEPADAALGLGLLAFGAAGVREMRRRRRQAA